MATRIVRTERIGTFCNLERVRVGRVKLSAGLMARIHAAGWRTSSVNLSTLPSPPHCHRDEWVAAIPHRAASRWRRVGDFCYSKSTLLNSSHNPLRGTRISCGDARHRLQTDDRHRLMHSEWRFPLPRSAAELFHRTVSIKHKDSTHYGPS